MNLIAAAVLFGPAAVAGPAVVLAWWRHRGEHDAMLAAAASIQTRPEQPPDGGMPLPAPTAEPERLAEVIPLRRAA